MFKNNKFKLLSGLHNLLCGTEQQEVNINNLMNRVGTIQISLTELRNNTWDKERVQELIDICDYTLIELDNVGKVTDDSKIKPLEREAKFYQSHSGNYTKLYLDDVERLRAACANGYNGKTIVMWCTSTVSNLCTLINKIWYTANIVQADEASIPMSIVSYLNARDPELNINPRFRLYDCIREGDEQW